jgi:molybdopterin synthase sulfur carrier subunit
LSGSDRARARNKGPAARTVYDEGAKRTQGGVVAVEVRIPTVFRKYTNQQAIVELEPGTIADLVERLEDRFPGMRGQLLTGDGDLHRFVNVYLNDEDVRYLDKLDTKASEGDVVSVLPSVAGGGGRATV